VHRPFFEVDGALVRVRVPGGALDPTAARAIATAAVDVGAGPVELTNRANLQVRGIPIDAVAALRDALVAAGVAAPDPQADERRNVLASPTAGVDADELVDPRPLVAAVADRLVCAGPARALSPKFGVLVDAGGAVHLRGRGQDLAFGAGRDEHGTVRYEVRIGDALPYPSEGGDGAWSVAPDRALEVLDAVIDAAAPFGRARDLVAALGPDRVWRDLVHRTGDALTGPAPLVGPAAPSVPVVGVHAQRQPQQVWIGLAVVLGRLDSATLLALADLTASVGGGLRITPWGGIILADVDQRDASRVVAACEHLGLVCDPDHPANLVVTCAGSRGCAAGLADTQSDARALVDRLADLAPEQRPASVHVSGCDKGCARPQPAQLSLVAGPTRGTYQLYVDRPYHASGRFGELLRSGLDPSTAIDEVATRGGTG
jgi:precorrin-3B synthase